ncbi:MAG: EAL domain-containing protein [Gammaproteobacteria bacterium]
MKFLIVDDIDDNRLLLRHTLESRGFTVQEAGNGIQALDLARVEPPDIIISDVLMPEMDGFTLCRVLKGIEQLKQIPFIFYTSTCLEKEDEKLGMALGASRYLLKPVDLSEFLLSIDEIISEHAKGILPVTGSTLNSEPNLAAHPQARKAQKPGQKIRDVSEQVPNEEKIKTLFQAIEQSPLSVIITDTNASIEYVNQAFEQITGYASDDVIGKNPRLLKTGNTPKSFYKELWQAISKGKSWKGELQNQKKNGEIFWELGHFSPVVDERGTIQHYLAIKEDITKNKQQEELVTYQTHFDVLTELPNRFLSIERLTQLLNEAQRDNKKVAVLFLDLDDFNKINDSLGHETGDKLALEVSTRLQDAVRSVDTVGRLGGDEFIVLLSSLEDVNEAGQVAENILNRFEDVFHIDDRDFALTLSVGITNYPDDGKTPSELLRKAESAMKHTKQLGRNSYSYFTDLMNREVSRRLQLEEQIHGALGRGEFSVNYQPQIDIPSNRIIGTEALLRWDNPALGQIPPLEFIPIAEETGLIIPLGKFALTEALAITALWQKKYSSHFRIAVNLSRKQFLDPELVNSIEAAIKSSGITPDSLELEITESVLLSGHSYIDAALEALKDLDISIAMDDFGPGYSSLSYLRSYPFSVLKIDQSFVRDIERDSADRQLISAAISMAHGLRLKVVAEGVENTEQLDYLKHLGCDYAQGYLFSKPLPSQEMDKLIESGIAE